MFRLGWCVCASGVLGRGQDCSLLLRAALLSPSASADGRATHCRAWRACSSYEAQSEGGTLGLELLSACAGSHEQHRCTDPISLLVDLQISCFGCNSGTRCQASNLTCDGPSKKWACVLKKGSANERQLWSRLSCMGQACKHVWVAV